MTLAGSPSASRPNTVWDFVSVGPNRACDAVSTGAYPFGSTLALHSIELRGNENRVVLLR